MKFGAFMGVVKLKEITLEFVFRLAIVWTAFSGRRITLDRLDEIHILSWKLANKKQDSMIYHSF